jgi:hypothetical protein
MFSSGLEKERRVALDFLQEGEKLPDYLAEMLTGATPEEIETHFQACQQELDIATALVLIAHAEARVRTDAQTRRNAQTNNLLNEQFRSLFDQKTISWKVPLYQNGILDVWKGYIRTLPDLHDKERDRMISHIGSFKKLLDLRHWVAHGRYWAFDISTNAFSPQLVARTIESLFQTLKGAAHYGGLEDFQSKP